MFPSPPSLSSNSGGVGYTDSRASESTPLLNSTPSRRVRSSAGSLSIFPRRRLQPRPRVKLLKLFERPQVIHPPCQDPCSPSSTLVCASGSDMGCPASSYSATTSPTISYQSDSVAWHVLNSTVIQQQKVPQCSLTDTLGTYTSDIVSSVSLRLENSGSVARDHLASERTFLAYMRTSLAIASAGVGELHLPLVLGHILNACRFFLALVQLFAITAASSSSYVSITAHKLHSYARPLGAATVIMGLIVLVIGPQISLSNLDAPCTNFNFRRSREVLYYTGSSCQGLLPGRPNGHRGYCFCAVSARHSDICNPGGGEGLL